MIRKDCSCFNEYNFDSIIIILSKAQRPRIFVNMIVERFESSPFTERRLILLYAAELIDFSYI